MTDNLLIPAWVDGALTPVDKLEAHRQGIRHKAVSVFINCGTETLFQRRALSKYHTPGLWANACCTHPYWEEDPQDCAIRRLREELGVNTTCGASNISFGLPNRHGINNAFLPMAMGAGMTSAIMNPIALPVPPSKIAEKRAAVEADDAPEDGS